MNHTASDPSVLHHAGATDVIARPLAQVRSAARRLLVTRETAWIIACLTAAVLVMVLVDYVLRMPWGVRLGFWLAGAAILAVDIRRRLIPALRFNPPLSEVSLRLERTSQAAEAGLRGILTSGLELSGAPARESDSRLRAQVVERARERLQTVRPSRAVLSRGPARRSLALAALALAPLVALSVWQPALASVGLRRVLTPWTAAAWPKRTAIADATAITAHPVGAAVPLRAVVTHTDRAPGKTDVWAIYRLVTQGREAPARRALLTGQGRAATVAADDARPESHGELYERLVEPSGLSGAEAATPGSAAPLTLEYWFETDDDRTPETRIVLVEPPAVVTAAAIIQPPAYAAGSTDFLSGSRELGNGRDERASLSPILAGSEIALHLTLNKPVPAPEKLVSAFPGALLPPGSHLEAEGAAWTLTWTAAEPLRLPVTLTDEYGITADRDAAFQFGVVADRPPAAAVVEPAQDESVLTTAILNVVGEGRDDAGLSWTSLEMQAARPPDSQGAPAEATGPAAELARVEGAAGEAKRQLLATVELDLSTRGLKPRDEVWLTAIAKDTYAAEGREHDPARSSTRRLRIISESDLVEQVRTELSGVRQAAMRLDQDQADISRRAQNAEPAETRPLQEGLTQRVAPQGDVVKRLGDRIARNNLVDRSLAALLDDSARALADAEHASGQAARDLDEADRAALDPKARDELARDAADKQREVRDQLGRLIALLDRGQDGYTIRREVQRLIDEQRRLMEETRALGEQTRGQKPGDLPGPQRDALEQTAGQQQDLARRAAQMLSDMAQRSLALERQDPALSQAMARSAQRGRQDEVPDKQRQASEQVRQNQTGAANQSQQQALQSLQQMMEDLDQSERQRDEALKRVLEDAIESIQALISTQEHEILALDRAMPLAEFTGLDASMIRLHGDTLGVSDKIRSSFRELAPVADLVDGAARAQAAAIAVLRSQSPDGPEASQSEHLSLERLKEARAEAEKLRREADDKDKSRKRDELRRAYQETLESQVALHGKTVALVGKELDRRERAGVRGLGEQQVQIRTRLQSLRDEHPDIEEARLFEFAHKRLDDTTSRAAASLGAGAVTAAVDRDQLSTIHILQSLVEALKQDAKKKDFRDTPDDGSGGGGGSGSGGGRLIPRLAELRLLKLMQVDVADRTREADGAADKPDAASLEELGQIQEQLMRRAQELFESNEQAPAPDKPEEHGPTANFDTSDPPAPQPAPPPPPPQPDKALPPTPPAAEPHAAEPPKDNPLPTLDELLGLPKRDAKSGNKPTDADHPATPDDGSRTDLERQLGPEQAAGAQADLIALLHQASDRLNAQRDPGITTQRAQADAIRRLDQLIDMFERNAQQRQSNSRRQQTKQPQNAPNQGSQQNQPKPGPGDNRAMIDPPPRQNGPLKPPGPGAGARWGNLPDHVRDALRQGMNDQFSSLYRELTARYYQRLAEEPKPAGAPR